MSTDDFKTVREFVTGAALGDCECRAEWACAACRGDALLAALDRIEAEVQRLRMMPRSSPLMQEKLKERAQEAEAERDALRAIVAAIDNGSGAAGPETLRAEVERLRAGGVEYLSDACLQARREERERAKQAVRLTFSDSNNCERCLQEAANAIDALGDG